MDTRIQYYYFDEYILEYVPNVYMSAAFEERISFDIMSGADYLTLTIL